MCIMGIEGNAFKNSQTEELEYIYIYIHIYDENIKTVPQQMGFYCVVLRHGA